jgi:hypothetical protein
VGEDKSVKDIIGVDMLPLGDRGGAIFRIAFRIGLLDLPGTKKGFVLKLQYK